ncbi:hypothetical protein K5I29_08875 [Flavobacterium agricola]|uniref:Uncharacterized protein n=1 Tax=Flavobacterium agricola TaxID=2870839 RepID=A0ABY6LWE0_9FLAO|nr:hypothetical protein [Flavobacterium agricola]UYW00649.1 hypothetical protein K5I29_08875 [Flavobacterium agricola]
MKEFNHTFSNSRNVPELERPAYERLGINLSTTENKGTSRISVNTTENNELKMRSNNSFLHDNVD